MIQSSPMLQLQGRFPSPPPSRRVRPSLPYTSLRSGVSGISTGMASPPPSGDWAARSRHTYGWPVPYPPPARPEQIQRRSPWLYGQPFHYGMGDTAQQAGGVVSAGATAAAPAAVAAGLIPAAAVPFIGPAIAGIVLGIEAILHSGCGNTCVITSNWANQAEALLEQNKDSYFALSTPRAQSAQTIALQNFDKIWNYLVQECSSPQVGNAGVRCISDRQAGSCKWRDSLGQCWNWFIGYRNPIANDPNVVPDSQSSQAAQFQVQSVSQGTALPGAGGSVAANTGTSGVFDSKTLLVLGLAGVALVMVSQGGKGGS